MGRAVLFGTLLAAGAAVTPAAAQQAPPRPPTEAQREAILERLRALGPASEVREERDTLAADTLADGTPAADPARGRPGAPRRPAGAQARGADIAMDSVMAELMALPGYQAMLYQADSARFSADSARVWLGGPADVSRAGQGMHADSQLVYDLDRDVVCGFGSPTLTGTGDAPVISERVCYDVGRRVGVAIRGETTFRQGAEWRVRGDELYSVGSSRVFVHDAIFTDCELEEPHYHFAARDVKVVRDSVMVARDITLNFADVPVFWLPFMVQSLRRGRRSGLLTPEFSVNDIATTSSNYQRRFTNLGFYWAVNDYMGGELAFDWFSNTWRALRGRFEYRFLDQFLSGGMTYRQFWKEDGSRDLTLRTDNRWQPDERTNVQLNANFASSADFVRRNTFDPRELSRSVDSNAGLARRFDWGNLDVSANRRQFLTDGKVELSLPSVSLNLSPVTLFGAPPSQASWYNNASFNARTRYSRNVSQLDELNASTLRQQETQRQEVGFNGTFRLGDLSWTQTVSGNERVTVGRTVSKQFLFPDSIFADSLPGDSIFPGGTVEEISWSTGVNYTQRLLGGGTTIRPRLDLRGTTLRSDTTGMERVAGPMRLDFGAALQTNMYGFWPGAGPFSRMRHKISPTIQYSYSPEPTLTERQEQFFSVRGFREQNRISIGLSQTIEAKYREDRDPRRRAAPDGATGAAGRAADPRAQPDAVDPAAPGDPEGPAAEAAGDAGPDDPENGAALAEDTAGLAATANGDPEEGPRRRQEAQPTTILSLNTSALVYDWVAAREGEGFTTTTLDNSITSDFLQGLRISMSHELFRQLPAAEPGGDRPPREFALHLRQINASFSLNNRSGIFQILGLGGSDGPPVDAERDRLDEDPGEDPGLEDREDADGGLGRSERNLGMMGSGAGGMHSRARGRAGNWNANVNYSLVRPRPVEEGGGGGESRQMIQGTISYQPTEHWSLNWRTGYSITDGRFQDHIVTLTRDLHDWEANFDFIQAQNGNFSFQFRVFLRANQDLKLDYEQRSNPPVGGAGRGGERF